MSCLLCRCSEFRSCVKVEVAVLGSSHVPSGPYIIMVSVDVKQH